MEWRSPKGRLPRLKNRTAYYAVTNHLKDGSTFEYDLPLGELVLLSQTLKRENVEAVTLKLERCTPEEYAEIFE